MKKSHASLEDGRYGKAEKAVVDGDSVSPCCVSSASFPTSPSL
jgi:hypothetical protein